MDCPVFMSIQPPYVAHADAGSAAETLVLVRLMAAATKNAENTTVRSRDPRLAGGAQSSEVRWFEPAVFFMISPAVNNAAATTFPYFNSRGCAIRPVEAT